MYYVAKIIVEENSEQYYCTILSNQMASSYYRWSRLCAVQKRAQNYTDFGLMAISFYIREIQNVHTTLRVLTDNRPTDELPCEYCGRVNSNRQWHILTECHITHNKRADLLVKSSFLGGGGGVQAIPPHMTFSDVLYSMLCGDRLDGNTDD